MASVRDRIILLPRFTTLAGEGNFTTQAMNVAAYESAEISVWMGRIVGDGSVAAEIEESTDRVVWSLCAGTSSVGMIPLTEELLTPDFSKAWMRLKMLLSAGIDASPIATVWAAGFANKRNR